MKFDEYNFSPEIMKGIDAMGFKRPTDIQYKAIPPILRGEDVLAIAQTGTGKTAAFAIPVLNLLQKQKENARRADGVKCIVLVPTHELALQIEEVFNSISQFTNLNVLAIFGGVEQDYQINELEHGIDVLIATPGRMFDLISQGHLRVHRVETLVLDEADLMLDLGFLKDIRDLTAKLPMRRQTLFFSATINNKIKKLAYLIINQNAIRIKISPKDPVTKNVEHAVAFIEMDDKRFFLERIINENPDSKILVFVRTKVRAERVSSAMLRVGISSLTIHSDREQHERSNILEQFKKGEERVLIATDITARGIDIPSVDVVINYDLPDLAENYVHRVGRTGRGKNKGRALSFCSSTEKEKLADIEDVLGKEITVVEVTKQDVLDVQLLSDEKSNDYMKLIEAEEEFQKSKKKKNKKK